MNFPLSGVAAGILPCRKIDKDFDWPVVCRWRFKLAVAAAQEVGVAGTPSRKTVRRTPQPQTKICFQIQQRNAPARATTYVPFRTRSYYTFLDSTLSPAAIVNLARQNGLSAIALTDIGNLHGANTSAKRW